MAGSPANNIHLLGFIEPLTEDYVVRLDRGTNVRIEVYRGTSPDEAQAAYNKFKAMFPESARTNVDHYEED